MSKESRDKENQPFFLSNERALTAMPFWLKKHIYDDFTVGSRTKKNQPVINLIKSAKNPESRSKWVAGIIIDDEQYLTRAIEIIQSNMRSEV